MNYVTSYVNPDLDGTACMIAMAALRGKHSLAIAKGEGGWEPVRFGENDFETEFVLEKLGLPAPCKVSDISDADAVILVDTHHKLQLPENFPYDKVIQIIDHHLNGDVDDFPNAEIINLNIGAAATIVADMYIKADIWDEKMLRLLAFAMNSNTVEFKGALTKDFDRDVYAKIIEKYPISKQDISDMMHARLKILDLGLRTAIESDIKVFDTKHGQVGIAQLKMPGLLSAMDLAKAEKELCAIARDMGLKYFFMNASDTEIIKSVIITVNPETAEIVGNLLGVKFNGATHEFDRVLVRKKDLVFDKDGD